MYCKFLEMNKEVNIRSPGGSTRAKMLWRNERNKGEGDEYFHPASEPKIDKWDSVRQELLSKLRTSSSNTRGAFR